MALGVLNNLSAIYAENNLNNTNASLQTVLQQLSSGSRINSGADDAAGLSLVNGLAANSAALTQSETNATEGAGMLQVADGALSQVTSLLDRAVTLATEASNGTLNSSQSAAANQEYQSILSEINNIGSTTTFNQQQVFNGQNVAIYTGDSSTTGSSIDDLYLRSLSEASVGDSGGVMSYSSGQDNVFLNLSTTSANATTGDTLNSGGQTTIDVKYLVDGANGQKTTASTQISVGTGTNYNNTTSGLITAINDAGLGLTATFATQANAGVTGGGSETGIEITGGLISAGFAPSSVSTSGLLNPSGIPASELLTQGQVVTVTQNGNTVGTVTINPSINTLQELAHAISTGTGTGVTGFTSGSVLASVVTNGDGTQSLSLADATASDGMLNVTAGPPTTVAPVFGAPTTGSTVPMATAGTSTPGTAYAPAVPSSVTVATFGGGDSAGETLTAGTSITIKNTDTQTMTFIVGTGTNNVGTGTYYTNANGDTLGDLATTITALSGTLGATASAGTNGLTITATQPLTGENVSVTNTNLTSSTSSTQLSLYSPQVAGQTLVGGAAAVTVLDNGVAAAAAGDTLTGSIVLSNSYGAFTFVAGAGVDTANTFYLANQAGGNTYTGLVQAVTQYSADLGYTAAWVAGGSSTGHGAVVLTASALGNNPITVGTNSLADISHAGNVVADSNGVTGTDNQVATSSTAILQLGSGIITDTNPNASTLAGAIKLSFNGNNQVFIMGSQPTNGTAVAGAIYTNAYSVTSLVNAINAAGALGLQASAPGGGTGGIYLQGGTGIAQQILTPALAGGNETPLAVVGSMSSGAPSLGATGQAGNNAVYNLTAGATAVSTSDLVSGQVTITNNSGSPYTFIAAAGVNSGTTYYTDNTATVGGYNYGETLAGLATTITAAEGTTGFAAQANSAGLTLTQSGTPTTYTGGNISANLGTDTLQDVTAGKASSVTLGTFASESDSVNGTINFEVNGVDQNVPLNAGSTVASMIKQITNGGYGVTANWVATSNGFGNVVITANAEGSLGQISTPLAALTDTTTTANLTYSASSAYNTGLTSDATYVVYDTSTGQSGTIPGEAATFVSDARSGSGIATISYSDGSGEALNGTDLTNEHDSETALNQLNVAISDVAAQDGYIGAQINTLNALSQVMSTQQENVVSAQNAVQATDYASATSNMSKYEILSQTGIAALAQANQVQQEVTKLLQ
ncbi:MAG: flagellin [Terracidiphilus sp.]